MDKRLLPYFESVNDGAAQGDYLSEFGPKEVQGGICLHLVITWMYFYKKDAQNTAPNIIWQRMKQPEIIKQIAQNQLAYTKEHYNVLENINFYKIIAMQNTQECRSLNQLLEKSVLDFSKSSMFLLVIDLERNSALIGRHAIGVIRHNGKIYMYDPNAGVLSVEEGRENELLDIIRYIYEEKAQCTIPRIQVYSII